jgi:ketosteroid isomerase-like protein
MSQENVELAHRAYDAVNRRDLDAVLALMDPEVEFMEPLMEMEGEPYYRGHSGVREFLRSLLAVFPDYKVEVLEMRDFGDSMIVALRIHGHGLESNAPFDEPLWHAIKLRDGKVTWWGAFFSEAEALEAAGPRE